jgi:hypothetical protein
MALLRRLLSIDLENILILEDDVDFSIHIKEQMELLSQTMWQGRDHEAWEHNEDPYDKASWDLLWLGHFGMEFVANTDLTPYNDPHALPWEHLYADWNSYYADQRGQDPLARQQLVGGIAPLDSFAIGMNRADAARLVEENTDRTVRAWNFTLHGNCKGLVQRCTGVVPELFHHHKVTGASRIMFEGEKVKQDLEWYKRQHKYLQYCVFGEVQYDEDGGEGERDVAVFA